MDKSLTEFMYTVPTEHLMKNGFTKSILRSSMKGIVQDQVLLNKEKTGFNFSVSSIFNFKSQYMKNNILNKKNKMNGITLWFKNA